MYTINGQHRDNNPNKAQWTIPESAEMACFNLTVQNNWRDHQEGWGLHLVDAAPEYLGILIDRTMKSFFAKFVGTSAPLIWHGYPADHQNKSNDIPYPRILKSWHEKEYISAATMRKIQKGQPCDL